MGSPSSGSRRGGGENSYLRDASPGYGNSPPGETFGIKIYKTPNAVIRDSEIDGRDVSGNRTCASPIGWNNVISWSSGAGGLSGSGINHEQSGGRIRHIRPRLFLNGAKSQGPVRGKYGHPAADDSAKTSSNGATFGLATGLTDAGADFEMWYPEWDNTLGSSGIICMASYNGDALGHAVKTAPKIYLQDSAEADYQLLKRASRLCVGART